METVMVESVSAMQQNCANLLRHIFRNSVDTVWIVSHQGLGSQFRAVTITSLVSLAFEPPSLLFCLNRKSLLRPDVTVGSRITLSMCANNQEDIAQLCAGGGSPEARKSHYSHRQNSENIDLSLLGAAANISAKIDAIHEHGTHSIIIANIESCDVDGTVQPLIYHNRQFYSEVN